MYFCSVLKTKKKVLREREAALVVLSTPKYVSDIETSYFLLILFLILLLPVLPYFLFIKLFGLASRGVVFHIVKVDGIWSTWFLAAALILAFSALATPSSVCSSVQLPIPAEPAQGQLPPGSWVLCCLVSRVNHRDDVPWRFHEKLLLSFICLRHGLPVDFLPPVLTPVTFKNILIPHTGTVDVSNLHSLTAFGLEVTDGKSWVG